MADIAKRLGRIEGMLKETLDLIREIHSRRSLHPAEEASHEDTRLEMLRLIHEADNGVDKATLKSRTGMSGTTIWRYAREFRDLGLLRYEPEDPHSRFNVNRRVFRSTQLTRKGRLLVENGDKLPPNWWILLKRDGFSSLRKRCGF